MLDFLILSFATWRLSSLLATPDDDGPWEMFLRFRRFAGVEYDENTGYYFGTNEFSKGLICVWCVSFWIGLGLGLLYYFFGDWIVWFSLPFALSAAAIIVERIVDNG